MVIIGSLGQLGSDLKPYFEPNFKIHSLEWPEFKIENEKQVDTTLKRIKPEFVINTAAFHNLNECEKDPLQSFLVNAVAIKFLAESCNKIDATLIHFSTDYVFGSDRARNTPYVETDLTGPVQIYGNSKLAGERILNEYCNKSFCFRISGLYGIKGTNAKKYANFVEMMITLGKEAEKKGEKLPSAKDQTLTFNPTEEIAKVVGEVLKTDQYGLYHATCEGYSSRMEFVKTLFEIMDIKTEVFGVSSDYFNPVCEQPKFSALENRKLKKLGISMPHWKDALENYLKKRIIVKN